jgi:HSP20 family protein
MTSIMRWDPFAELASFREAMNRLFEDVFSRRSLASELTTETVWAPAIDMYETDEEVVVKAMLPGLKKDDLEVTFSDDVLTIKGETKRETETKKRNYYHKELAYGQFARSIALPVTVKPEQAKAEFKDGILEIHIPKAEEAKPKVHKLEIK